jgi:uncharacterized protein YjeT (DUF2065 family)
MTFLDGLSMLLVVGGVLLTFISFANRENLTGLWVAGKIDRDRQFQEAGRFRPQAYHIFRAAGILAFLAGLAIMYLLP